MKLNTLEYIAVQRSKALYCISLRYNGVDRCIRSEDLRRKEETVQGIPDKNWGHRNFIQNGFPAKRAEMMWTLKTEPSPAANVLLARVIAMYLALTPGHLTASCPASL